MRRDVHTQGIEADLMRDVLGLAMAGVLALTTAFGCVAMVQAAVLGLPEGFRAVGWAALAMGTAFGPVMWAVMVRVLADE